MTNIPDTRGRRPPAALAATPRVTLAATLCVTLGVTLAVTLCVTLAACGAKAKRLPMDPPPTDPLTRDAVGYGVVTSSFIHLMDSPGPDAASLGYLRRGSLARVVERITAASESWLLVDTVVGEGWLRDADVEVYDNEARARAAAGALGP